MTNHKPKLLTTEEAAAVLGKAPGTLVVWRCTKRYDLPFLKIGGSVRYREEDLLAFLDAGSHMGSIAAIAEIEASV